MEQFDAYHKWLGIRPEEQPPNHYRLLGIAAFESDHEVISAAANQRTVYLRQRAAGPQQALVKKLLDEVASARNCLLDPKKKATYDARLNATPGAEPPTGVLRNTAPAASSAELDAIAAEPPASAAAAVRQFSSSKAGLASFGLTAVVVIAVVAYLLSDRSQPTQSGLASAPGTAGHSSAGSDSAATAASPTMRSDDGDSASGESTADATKPAKADPVEPSTPARKPGPDDSEPIATAVTDPREVLSMLGHRAPVVELAASTDGRYVVSASQGRDRASGVPIGECLVWDATSGKLLYRYEGHSGLVRSVAVSPDGRHVLSSGDDLRVWELESGRDVRELKTSRRPANRVAFARDGRAASVGAGTLILWDIKTGDALQQVTGLPVFSQALAFSLDGRVVAAGTGEKGEAIGLWDCDSGAELAVLSGHKSPVRGIAFCPDGRHLWSFDSAQRALLWDLATGGYSHQIGPLTAQRVTPDGRFMVFGSEKEIVRVMDSLTARVVGSFPSVPCQVHDLVLLPDAGQIVFAGSGTGSGDPEPADFALHVWTLPAAVKLSPEVDPPSPLALARKPAPASVPAPTPKRLAPPSGDALKSAQQQVRDIFKADMAQAKRPDQKGLLAAKLIRQADDTRDDAAGRFVLLTEARDLFVASLNVDDALQVSDRLAEAYDVEALPLKLESLRQLSANLKSTLAMQSATEVALDLADECVLQEKFDTALELTRVATSLAVKSKLGRLRDDTKARTDLVVQKRKLHDEAEQARATLENDPEDASAHDKLGRYLCFVREDWEAGLPHLVRSMITGLRTAAELELAAASDPPKLIEVADAWYDYAKTARAADKPFAQARALKWYRDAGDSVTGLARVRVQTRIAELSKLVPDAGRAASGRKTSGS